MNAVDDRVSMALWGKAGPTADHPLACHLIDVAATAEALLGSALSPALRQRLTARLGPPLAIAAWCGLHDLGKASPAFQIKRPDLAQRLPRSASIAPVRGSGAPHGLVTAWELPELLAGRWGMKTARSITAPVAAHHGYFEVASKVAQRSPSAAGVGWWVDQRAALVELLFSLFDGGKPEGPLSVTDAVLLAGLCSVSDWLGSNTRWFPLVPVPGRLEAYRDRARAQAIGALDELHWKPWRPISDEFEVLFPGMRPRGLQTMCIAAARQAPGMLIVEAPVGEGKTEAALAVAATWARERGLGGLYVGLPTQATANAMFSRLLAFLARATDSETANTQLLHGSAWLHPDLEALRESQRASTTVVDDDDPSAGVVVEEWFTNRKRGLLAAIGVGTVDQVLLAGLRTKHGFVRLFGLAGKVVVIDEAHAYDAYMSCVLDRTLEWLAAMGSSVVVLSATLPTRRRGELVAAWQHGLGSSIDDPTVQSQAEYPLITTVTTEGVRYHRVEPTRRWQVTLDRLADPMHTPAGQGAVVHQAVQAAIAGGNVLVIASTVAMAQQLYRQVFDAAPGCWTLLVHARFCAQDRARLEGELLSRLGAGGDRPAGGIVVATQVAEQSLDIDADLLFTDLAPVDLLIQRLGRLHRHARTRAAGFERPVCRWAPPPMGPAGCPRFEGWPTSWVYEPHVLLRTWVLLRDRAAMDLPVDVRRLIDAVYGEELAPPDGLEDLWHHTRRVLDDHLAEQRENARTRFLPPPSTESLQSLSWDAGDEDDDVHPSLQALTRLGRPTTTAVVVWTADGCWALDPDGRNEVDVDHVPSLEHTRALLGRGVPVTNPRLVRALPPTPPAWRRSPWLRRARPLPLHPQAPTAFDGLEVSYSDVFGLQVFAGGSR